MSLPALLLQAVFTTVLTQASQANLISAEHFPADATIDLIRIRNPRAAAA
jgi:hypothetical protein